MVDQVQKVPTKIGSGFSWLVLFGFIVVNSIWGSTFLGIKIAVETIPPFFMAGTRFLLAGFIIVLLSRLAGNRMPNQWAEWRTAIFMGILLLAMGNGFVSYAEVYVPSNQAALLISTSAVWMAWMGSLGPHGEALTRRIKLGLVIGMLGLILMFWPEAEAQFEFLGSKLMILVASISWSFGTIYFRNQNKQLHPTMFAGAQMLSGGLVLLLFSLILGEWQHIQYNQRSLAAWIYLVVFGSCFAFGFYIWLIDKIKPSNLAMISYITPLIATSLGWWVLDETLSIVQLIGMVVIITSIILVTLPKRPASVRKFY